MTFRFPPSGYFFEVNVEYVIANSDEQIYFLNTNLRQDMVAKKDLILLGFGF